MAGGIDLSKNDLSNIEDEYAKLIIKSFRDEGLEHYADNLSVSMPINEKIAFIDSCRFNGRYWRDVLLDFIRWYTEKNGHEVCLEKADRKIEEWIQRKIRIQERQKLEGSKKAETILKYIEEVFDVQGIEKSFTGRGNNKSFVDRVRPVEYNEVRQLFSKLEDLLNKKYKRHTENNGYRFSLADLYPFVVDRAMKISNESVRKSLLENLKQFKEVVDRDPVTVEREQKKKVLDEQFDEYFKSRTKVESNDLIVELQKQDTAGQLPNFGAGAAVKRDDR